jgi:hypothetical protein
LFPDFFSLKVNRSNFKATAIAAFISFCFCLLTLMGRNVAANTFNYIAILAELSTNICILICYIMLRLKYSEIARAFNSPFGVFGAIYSILIFLLTIISIVGNFQDQKPTSFVITVMMGIILSIYYFFYAQKHQTFSNDEQQSLFKFHVININQQKRRVKVFKYTNNNSSSTPVSSVLNYKLFEKSSGLYSHTLKNVRKVHITASFSTESNKTRDELINGVPIDNKSISIYNNNYNNINYIFHSNIMNDNVYVK